MPSIPDNELISGHIDKGKYFFLNLLPSDTLPMVVHYGGREHCEPDYRVERDGFPYQTLEFVVDGKGRLTLGRDSYTLLPGMVYTYGPNDSHLITTDPEAPMFKYFVCFGGLDVGEWINRSGLSPTAPVMMAQSRWIASVFDQLIDCGNSRLPDTAEICEMLLRLIFKRVPHDMLPEIDAASPAFQTYQSCRRRIEHECLTLQSVSEVAQCEHVDPAYLSRLFKRYAHETPYQLLLRLKMDYAAAILIDEHKSVKETAAQVGFQDPYHFSRVFKSKHGLSPMQFVKEAGRQ